MASASVLRLSVAAQVDSALFNNAAPGAVAANDNTLLLVLVEIDAGAVKEDAAGIQQVEIFSLVDWQAYGSGTPTFAI